MSYRETHKINEIGNGGQLVDEEEHFNYDFDKDSRVNEISQGALELHQLHAQVQDEIDIKNNPVNLEEDSEEPDPSVDLENLEIKSNAKSLQPQPLKKIADERTDKATKVRLMQEAVGNFIKNMLDN